MDFQALYELADRELTAGLADERLVSRALAEAKGVQSLARQVYCELRAKELRSAADDRRLNEVIDSVVEQEGRIRGRKRFNGWLWTIACFVGFLSTLVFSWLALSAIHSDGRFYLLGFMSVLSVALTVVSLAASRYHTE